METTNLQKQNRTLKVILAIILVVIFVPAISIGSIVAYKFLTKSDDQNTVAQLNVTANTNTSSPTPAQTPTAANSPVASPTATNPPGPSFPNPVAKVVPFQGRWRMIGGDGTTYSFEAPKKVGNTEVGLMRVTTAQGKSYDSNYTIIDRKWSKFEANGSEYTYEIEDNGQTLTLDYDGNILRFDRLK